MPCETKSRDKGCIDAFIGKPTHAVPRSAIYEFLIGEIVGSKGLSGPEIVERKLRMVGENCLRRHASSEFAQDQFHRDSRTADNGLASHNLGVDFDTLMRHQSIPQLKLQ